MTRNGSTQTTGQGSAAPLFAPSRTANTRRNRKRIATLRLVREGKDKGQGVGYLPDGTMVVVNNGVSFVGQQIEAQVSTLLQTGAGVIVFAEVRPPITPVQ